MQNGRGFTIVELLIVIVVIAILAAITIVSYNGIQSRSVASAIQSDLSNAAKAMELAKIRSSTDTYPLSLPDEVSPSSNVGLSLSEAGSSFCVNGQSRSGTPQFFHISTAGLNKGFCSGAVIEQSERGMPSNLVQDAGYTNRSVGVTGNWYVARNGSAGPLAVDTRSGTLTDPLPNQPVLRITNTANPAVTWSYLAGPVRSQDIVAGEPYTTSYWVRLASGNFSAPPNYLGAQNASSTNLAVPTGVGSGSITSTWREISRTIPATNNGTSQHILYLNISASASQGNSFTLELQGLKLHRAS